MKKTKYEILSGSTSGVTYQLPIFLDASVDEMGIMVGFDGEIEQIEQFCNFTYRSGAPPATSPPATASPTPTVTPTPSQTPGASQSPTPTVTPTVTTTPSVTATPTVTPTVTPSTSGNCVRPGGLTSYIFWNTYTPTSFYFAGSLTDACYARSLASGIGGYTGMISQVNSLSVAENVYIGVGTDCNLLSTGYYIVTSIFTDPTTTSPIVYVLNGVINSLPTCPP